MVARVTRETVDLSGYPDLVVMYLGMRVRAPRGVLKLVKLGREIRASRPAAGCSARGRLARQGESPEPVLSETELT